MQEGTFSTCFLFFILLVDTSCWLPRNCTAITCFSCRTWSYMHERIPSSLGHQKSLVVGQLFSGCKRTGEMQKAGCVQITGTKKVPKHEHKPNTKRKKTSRKLSETLRWNPRSTQCPLHDDIAIPATRKMAKLPTVKMTIGMLGESGGRRTFTPSRDDFLNSGNWTGFTNGTLPCAASSTRT